MKEIDFVKRLNNFSDGLIKEMRFYWDSQGNQERFEFLILLPVNKLNINELTVIIDGVQQFRLLHERSKLSYQVLSNGVHVTEIDGFWALEFGCFADPAISLNEIYESDFYIIGKAINFIVDGNKIVGLG